MEEVNLDNLDDVETASSDISDTDDEMSLSDMGLVVYQSRVGSRLGYDVVRRANISLEIPWNDFVAAICIVLAAKGKDFRNLVLSVMAGGYMHRRISLSKKRLRAIDPDIVCAFMQISSLLENNQYSEIYENYDAATVSNIYGYSPEDFRILTSIFEVAYDIDEGGGRTISLTYARYVIIEDAPRIYGVYDCFFECIHHALDRETPFDTDTIRRKIKAWPAKEIKAKHIKRFEKCTKIGVTVYFDAIDKGRLLTYYETGIKSSAYVQLVLFNAHYYIYRGRAEIQGMTMQGLDDNTVNTRIFYDFETYMDPLSFTAVPYTLSYCITEGGMIKQSGVLIRDEDQDDFNVVVYRLFHTLMDGGHKILIGYNNGAFDDYILIDILTRYSKGLSTALVNRLSRILEFRHSRLVSKDAYMFFSTSLSKASSGFGCNNTKGSLDHMHIQRMAYEGKLCTWIKEHKDEIADYAIADVYTLCELYFKARKTFIAINGHMDMDKYLTLPQMSMKAFNMSLIQKNSDGKPIYRRKLTTLPRDVDKIVRYAMVGGRCQLFQGSIYEKRIVQSIDVISLYPYVMMHRKYPLIEYIRDGDKWIPTDRDFYHYTNVFCDDMVGVYYVTIINQPEDAIVPGRNKDGTLDWSPKCPFDTWIDSITLLCLRRYEGSFLVNEGYVITCGRDYIFKDFLEPLSEMKTEQDMYKESRNERYNPCLRECLKLLMNSLSGKTAQRPIDKLKTLCNMPQDIDAFIERHKDTACITSVAPERLWLLEAEVDDGSRKVTSPTLTAVMIYAYAREYMYDNFISRIKGKYFMDTDSLHFDPCELRALDPEIIGTTCGKARLELPENCYGLYAAKKLYVNFTENDSNRCIIRLRHKGITSNGRIVPSNRVEEIQRIIKERNYEKVCEVYELLSPLDGIELVSRVAKGDTIYILSDQLRLSSGMQSSTLSYRYVIRGYNMRSIEELSEVF